MTFFEWIGKLAATGLLTFLGVQVGFLFGALVMGRGMEIDALVVGLWWAIIGGITAFVVCLTLVYGVNLLPFIGGTDAPTR